jgi:PTS system nitrogen regulatory IIA component
VPTLRLADYLDADLVLWDLPCEDKPSLLRSLASGAAEHLGGVATADLLAQLEAREAQQTTGVGGGLALPHAELRGLEKTVVVVARPSVAVDFGAPDGESVDLLFLLLSPPGVAGEHLRLLARLARIFEPGPVRARLRGATGPGELLARLLEEDARHVL